MTKLKKVGLFDTDIFVFQAAAACTHGVTLQNGEVFIFKAMDAGAAVEMVKKRIDALIVELKLDVAILCITDKANWRKDILPTYKSNRKSEDKPEGLDYIKDQLRDTYEVILAPTLEADDVMGILATNESYYPLHRKIIISEDKDMKTIPSWLFNPAKDFQPYEVTESQADHFHLMQTLAGDTTDGYAGCPNIGMDTADSMLTDKKMFEAYEHTFKSGARKGESVTRWATVDSTSPWDTVVSCFSKAGLTESDAIIQAQVARICRDTEYDFKTKEVAPWLPY